MAKVTFTARTYGNAVSKLAIAATAIDKTAAGYAKTVNTWARLAAAGLSSNCITLESVKEGLIATNPKAKTLADTGNTLKGWFYALQRIANSDKGLDRLIAGEAFHTVARDCKPVQEQSKGKGKGKGKGKADKAKALSLNDCIAGLSYWIDTAIADGDKAKELASNKALVALVGKFAALDKAANGKATKASKAGRRGNIRHMAKPQSEAGSGRKVRKATAVASRAVASRKAA